MEQLRQMDKRVSRKGTIISIIIGVIGIVMIALAYPLYERITKKERKKIAPLILKLADELKSKE